MRIKNKTVIPLRIAKIVSFISEIKFKYFNGEVPKLSATAIAILSARQFLTGDKAKNELGYTPSVNTEQAIKKTIEWFKSVNYIQ
ncbi:MAG: hypothetical protein U5L45_25395 [Saprospiraceae bacterium]|nr:hypothetical protein [Saprospiraceae bacterium]